MNCAVLRVIEIWLRLENKILAITHESIYYFNTYKTYFVSYESSALYNWIKFPSCLANVLLQFQVFP